MNKVISELVAINHSFATFDSDIFNIEIHGDKLHIYPRDTTPLSPFYRIDRVAEVLINNRCGWYMRIDDGKTLRITAW